MQIIIRFFDRFEDKIRRRFSHYPIIYALVGGVGIVLFWRGVWGVADELFISNQVSLLLGILILLGTGLFVSFFVGENIILTGLKRERKIAERTEEELRTEHDDVLDLKEEVASLERVIKDLSDKIRRS